MPSAPRRGSGSRSGLPSGRRITSPTDVIQAVRPLSWTTYDAPRWPLRVAALGVVLVSLSAAIIIARDAGAARQRRFETAVTATDEMIRDRLQAQIALLHGGAGLFAAAPALTCGQFADFVRDAEALIEDPYAIADAPEGADRRSEGDRRGRGRRLHDHRRRIASARILAVLSSLGRGVCSTVLTRFHTSSAVTGASPQCVDR